MQNIINIVGTNTSPNMKLGEGGRKKRFPKKEKLVEDLEDEMRSVCSKLFNTESKFDSMVLAHEEQQQKYEDAQVDIDTKDEHIAALQQTLQDERQHSLLVGPAGDYGMSVEELQSQVSQQEELLSKKDRQIVRWRRLGKNHRAALYKLDDTTSALDAAKNKCEALQKDLREQLAETNERHLQNLSWKEKAFQKEHSNKRKNLRKEFANREKNLSLQFSKKVANLEVELSEKEKSHKIELSKMEMTFQEKFSEKERTFKMKLSEMEKTFQIELSKKVKSFQEKFSERERSFLIEFSEREEMLQVRLSEREKTFQKRLSETEMSFQTELHKKEEALKQKLSEREESLQKEVSKRMELSELCEHWQKTAQQLTEENIKLQELLVVTKKKKRGFWSRLFKR